MAYRARGQLAVKTISVFLGSRYWLKGLSIMSDEALSSVVGNRTVNDGSAIQAFPGVEDQEEVRKAFQHHEAFAFRTSHRFLPGLAAML